MRPDRAGRPITGHGHLKVLSNAGLVSSEKRGRNMWYAVVPTALEALRAALVTR